MPTTSQELWTAAIIVGGLLLSGIVGRVWRPMRKHIAAIDVLTGRPERYPGDEEAKPGLAERLDSIDKAIRGVNGKVTSLQGEVDTVKQAVENMEVEYRS